MTEAEEGAVTVKPKIAYIIEEGSICGGVAVVCQHANRLAKRGFETCIVSTAGARSIDWFPGQAVPVYPLEEIPGDIDIGVATWWETTHYLYRLPIPRKCYFVQSDETRFYPPGRFERLFAEDSYRFGFEFITEAKWIQEWLKREFGVEAHYVPNGVDLEIFHPCKPLEPRAEKIRVLVEGPADMPSKGVAEAFHALEGVECEIWYVNYRGVPDPAWPVDRYFYQVPMAEMKRVYSSCDILLKLSMVEGSFGPPLEMMACGGVCVVARVTGMEESIVSGKNAIVVEPGDTMGVREAVKRLLSDEGLRERLMVEGRKTVSGLEWERSIDTLETLFLSPPAARRTFEQSFSAREAALVEAYRHLTRLDCELRERDRVHREERERVVAELERKINLVRDELNDVYHSRQWKIATAIRDARHSFRGLCSLPCRILRALR